MLVGLIGGCCGGGLVGWWALLWLVVVLFGRGFEGVAGRVAAGGGPFDVVFVGAGGGAWVGEAGCWGRIREGGLVGWLILVVDVPWRVGGWAGVFTPVGRSGTCGRAGQIGVWVLLPGGAVTVGGGPSGSPGVLHRQG